MFALPRHIANNMAIASNNILQNTSINFSNSQFRANQTKNPKSVKKNAPFSSRSLKNDLSILNLGLPGSFSTLKTSETSNAT